MSRRASLYAKQNPTKPRPKVRFSDELVFLDNIKENDIPALGSMLRRASLQVDISGINDAGQYKKKPARYSNLGKHIGLWREGKPVGKFLFK